MVFLALVSVVLGNLLDYRSTVSALRRTGTHELNPLIRRFGVLPVKAMATLLQATMVAAFSVYDELTAALAALVILIFYLVIFAHNNRQGR